MHQLRGGEGGELGPVDVVVLDPLLAQTDHLEPDVLSLSITVQPQSQILRLASQLLPNSNIEDISGKQVLDWTLPASARLS